VFPPNPVFPQDPEKGRFVENATLVESYYLRVYANSFQISRRRRKQKETCRPLPREGLTGLRLGALLGDGPAAAPRPLRA